MDLFPVTLDAVTVQSVSSTIVYGFLALGAFVILLEIPWMVEDFRRSLRERSAKPTVGPARPFGADRVCDPERDAAPDAPLYPPAPGDTHALAETFACQDARARSTRVCGQATDCAGFMKPGCPLLAAAA